MERIYVLLFFSFLSIFFFFTTIEKKLLKYLSQQQKTYEQRAKSREKCKKCIPLNRFVFLRFKCILLSINKRCQKRTVDDES